MSTFELESAIARHGHCTKELSEASLADNAANRTALRRELLVALAVLDRLDSTTST